MNDELTIQQIEYSSWANGPDWYWRDINVIAGFIAARLEQRPSTISVKQHKEKFGNVIVYCDLAAEGLIVKAFNDNVNQEVGVQAFARDRMLQDAKCYRSTYRNIVALLPQYENVIVSQADHRELIFEDVDQLNAWLDARHSSFRSSLPAKYSYIAADFDELVEELHHIYSSI